MANKIEIIVASTNPIKMEATKVGFEKMFPSSQFEVKGISIKSGVRGQPLTSAETRNGARNRATNARKANPQADYWVGLEGGVEEDDQMFNQNHHLHLLRSVVWCAILKSGENVFGEGQPGSYALPGEICRLILEKGMELGEADGSVGILTHGVLNRDQYYSIAVELALIRYINPDLYSTFL
ncbi:MAG: NTPase [Candidatus Amesbacteria bacterium GW2011_GWB1_47_26]|uniref:inosine/xanthosine triphosphatase n=1 Tax=Candidatus Amesbacteria bacterium GW2011_GWC2_45_19 TaxID=1618366 RepID=A0A0G1M401_9BACT|nr:MAG: NTPase [Candidatus Amesbacteria bacterium GW2011_GWC2_45_19]KKU38362.1 MAG: NTPase [Candidatus Amesbacteria bacterium GW2011_GWA1_46_35]KKU68795.1 MAG: NTPase [Microgenomates group bacterium GW2011_GWC1_47_20]KKU74905.1 MAG: NTPase [Candidatus Amesbacteria bacterium GW2011_GWB1_47_26]KKU80079.1 MAG: NTPase [Candidatus Amesbacteria bacterium GW2011_GWA2_47_70]